MATQGEDVTSGWFRFDYGKDACRCIESSSGYQVLCPAPAGGFLLSFSVSLSLSGVSLSLAFTIRMLRVTRGRGCRRDLNGAQRSYFIGVRA